MTYATLNAEFRFHFGADEDAAGRVFDAWKAKRLELFKREEVIGDVDRTGKLVEVYGVERCPPDDIPGDDAREGFIRQFCGKFPPPEPGTGIVRLLVDREAFAAWAKTTPTRKDKPTAPRAEWKKRALAMLKQRPDISAHGLMKACGWSRKSDPQGNLVVSCTPRRLRWDTFQSEISRLRKLTRT